MFVAELYSETGILLFPPTLNTLIRNGCHNGITCYPNDDIDEHHPTSSFDSTLARRWEINRDSVTEIKRKPADANVKVPWYTIARIVSRPQKTDAKMKKTTKGKNTTTQLDVYVETQVLKILINFKSKHGD
jgi:hypothetical protein